jgi:peptidoglycan/xylan/chitin deacetylase (PgdA/CDA1 family)
MDSDWPYRLAAGLDASLVEVPIHWALDDWEPYVYVPGLSGSGVIADPSDVESRWTAELEALVGVGGCFVLTSHPFASGRPARAAALERLIRHAQSIDGLWIATLEEIAAHVEALALPLMRIPMLELP